VSRTDRERLAELRARVVALYHANRRRGHAAWCGIDFDYVCPSTETYPFQWFWDSCLHAIVLSHLDPTRAESELTTLLANQWPDGFVSHVTYWGREGEPDVPDAYQIRGRSPWLSGSMQPPILAEAVAAVAARGRGAAFLREVLPAVRRYYDWCDRARDPDRDGLIAILEPHESGMDQTPAYDAYLGITNDDPATFEAAWRVVAEAGPAAGDRLDPRFAEDRFVVEDLAVNVLYAENQRVLAALLAGVGDLAGAAQLAERAGRTTAALFERCWLPRDEDFHGLAGRDEAQLPGGTVAGLLPILLDDLPATMVDRIAARLANPVEYGTRFPAPSVSRSSPAYRSAPAGGTVLWRGPSWINTNWYLARGLRRHGRDEPALRIEEASLELVERSGFREHYDAESGAGYGARSFAWSALVLDTLVTRTEGDPAG
jgi:glycogen debranching enzyme